MSTQRYPLAWPVGWTRTTSWDRARARFQSTSKRYVTDGTMRGRYERSTSALTLADAITRLGAELRRLGVAEGDWLLSTNVELRLDRYGVGTLDQAFAGYAALPPKGATWRATLGFGPDDAVTAEAVQQAFRSRARVAHPDTAGGSHDQMTALVEARDQALREVRA